MKAILKGQVVADSEDVFDCQGYAYFPSSSVRLHLLVVRADEVVDPLGLLVEVERHRVDGGSAGPGRRSLAEATVPE